MADDTNPLGNLFSAGMSFATGNPIGAAAGIAGLGLSIFGGIQKSQAADATYAAQSQITRLEQQQDAVRRKAMEVSARRQQIEALRNQQRAQSLALNNATSQGAQFGSGLQGGYGQIAGQTNWNLSGIGQNLASGGQMFDLNSQIGDQKLAMARAGSMSATATGMSSLGGSLLGSVQSLGKLTTGSTSTSSSNGDIPAPFGLGDYRTMNGRIV